MSIYFYSGDVFRKGCREPLSSFCGLIPEEDAASAFKKARAVQLEALATDDYEIILNQFSKVE